MIVNDIALRSAMNFPVKSVSLANCRSTLWTGQVERKILAEENRRKKKKFATWKIPTSDRSLDSCPSQFVAKEIEM